MTNRQTWRKYDTSRATYYRWRDRALAAGLSSEYFQYVVSAFGIKAAQQKVRKAESGGTKQGT